MIIVIMGVTGVGKSTLGARLAERLRLPFLEGDDFHPTANILKMRQGVALEDADRWPWLDALADAMWRHDSHGRGAVVACSALKRAYRERLRSRCPGARFALLDGEREQIRRRLRARRGHFMPAALLDSQLAALEPPDDDERVQRLDIAAPVPALEEALLASLAGEGLLPMGGDDDARGAQ